MLHHTRNFGALRMIAVCHCCVSSANVWNRPRGHCSQSSGTPAESSAAMHYAKPGCPPGRSYDPDAPLPHQLDAPHPCDTLPRSAARVAELADALA